MHGATLAEPPHGEFLHIMSNETGDVKAILTIIAVALTITTTIIKIIKWLKKTD